MSVASGSVSWAALIAGRISLNRLTVVAARDAKSRAVGLSLPSSQSGRLHGPSAGFFFPSRC